MSIFFSARVLQVRAGNLQQRALSQGRTLPGVSTNKGKINCKLLLRQYFLLKCRETQVRVLHPEQFMTVIQGILAVYYLQTNLGGLQAAGQLLLRAVGPHLLAQKADNI